MILKENAWPIFAMAGGAGRRMRKMFRMKKRKETLKDPARKELNDEFSDGRQYLDPEPEEWGWRNGK